MATGTYILSTYDIVHQVNVDIVLRNSVPEPIHLVQYDKTLPILEVKIWKNGSEYEIPDPAIVSIRLEKPDKHVVYNPSIGMDSDRKRVYFQITEQMTSSNGSAIAIVEIVTDGKIAGTASFEMIIDRNPVQNGAIESTEEFKSVIISAEIAEQAAESALNSKTEAGLFASSAEEAASSAVDSAASAQDSKTEAENWAKKSESFTHGGTDIREGEDTDNAQYYYNQIKDVAVTVTGGLIPKGTIFFEDLPLTGLSMGYMYNISDSFISDNRFKDGGGKRYEAGSNVYYTSDGYWDVLAAPPAVYGVKGVAQEDFYTGYINLSPGDLGTLPTSRITKEEYLAIPEEQRASDGILYFVSDW